MTGPGRRARGRGEEQDGPDQQGAPDDHPGSGDEGRARGESPFGLPLNRPGGGSPGSGSSPAGFGAGFGGGPGGGFPGLPDLGGMDPSDLGAMLEKVLGEAADNPELAEVMKSMGVDPTDPATQAAMRAQLGTFMAAQESPTGSRDLATEVARRHVMARRGQRRARRRRPPAPSPTPSPSRPCGSTSRPRWPPPPGARPGCQPRRVGRGDDAALVRADRAGLRRRHGRDLRRHAQAGGRARSRGVR